MNACIYLYFDTCCISSRQDDLSPDIILLLDMELRADKNKGISNQRGVFQHRAMYENIKISKNLKVLDNLESTVNSFES